MYILYWFRYRSSTRDEPTYECIPQSYEKHVIKYSIHFDDEFNDDVWITLPTSDNKNINDTKSISIEIDNEVNDEVYASLLELKPEDNQPVIPVIDPEDQLKQ